MKNLFKSFAAAFSMYSKIPMPRTEWDEKTLRYILCFFPLVGAVVGGVVFGALWLCARLGFNAFFTAAVVTTLPVLITGGIHLDGFLDTFDALSSYQPAEKKLEILKDAHVGAFAVIRCCVYFALYFGAASELRLEWAGVVCAGFVLSRALTAVMAANFRPARQTGSAASIQKSTDKIAVNVISAVYIAGAAAFMLWVELWAGLAACACAGLAFLVCSLIERRQFGGITGDLLGWFLQICELSVLLGAVIAGVAL